MAYHRVFATQRQNHLPISTDIGHLHEMSDSPFLIQPNPDTPGLSQPVEGVNETCQPVTLPVVTEKPITLFLNRQEIVTSMTLGDWVPELAVGYFLNQNMLQRDDKITGIDVDDDLGVVIVRTARETDFEAKMKRKIRTSGCAEGTAYGDMMERFDDIELDKDARFNASWLIELSKAINTAPSLYLSAGAIHGCVLCQKNRPLVYMEDIGRHNAVDKILGHLFLKNRMPLEDCVLMVSGRASFEIIQKSLAGRVGIICAVSAPSSLAVDMAKESGQTLIGFLRERKFNVYSHKERISGI